MECLNAARGIEAAGRATLMPNGTWLPVRDILHESVPIMTDRVEMIQS